VSRRLQKNALNSGVFIRRLRWRSCSGRRQPTVHSTPPQQPPGRRAVMPCGREVKAGMVRVWVAGKTVWSPCYMRALSERFRDKELIIKRYINSPSLLYFTLPEIRILKSDDVTLTAEYECYASTCIYYAYYLLTYFIDISCTPTTVSKEHKRQVHKSLDWLIEQGLTSHQTHYRSYQRRFLPRCM